MRDEWTRLHMRTLSRIQSRGMRMEKMTGKLNCIKGRMRPSNKRRISWSHWLSWVLTLGCYLSSLCTCVLYQQYEGCSLHHGRRLFPFLLSVSSLAGLSSHSSGIRVSVMSWSPQNRSGPAAIWCPLRGLWKLLESKNLCPYRPTGAAFHLCSHGFLLLSGLAGRWDMLRDLNEWMDRWT